jgi:hypothetical protein
MVQHGLDADRLPLKQPLTGERRAVQRPIGDRRGVRRASGQNGGSGMAGAVRLNLILGLAIVPLDLGLVAGRRRVKPTQQPVRTIADPKDKSYQLAPQELRQPLADMIEPMAVRVHGAIMTLCA